MYKVKLKWSRYRPGVAQRVGRGIALLFHDRGTRREWVVNSTPRPHFTPGKDPVHIVHEAGWASGTVWTGWKYRHHRESIPDRPARSQSLYRLSYRAHIYIYIKYVTVYEWQYMLCFAVPALFAWKIQFLYPNTGGSVVSGAYPLEVQDCKSFRFFNVSQISAVERGWGQWYEKWKRRMMKIRKK